MVHLRPMTVLRLALTPLVVWGIYLIRANVWFRLYPAVMVAIAFAFFAFSLFRTPIVECFARRMGESLDERALVYCRRVTWVWTIFLAVHLAVTIATVFAPYWFWAFYNGFLAYVLMGTLFALEYLVRRRIRRG